VRDLAGNALASAYTWSFTTTGDADPPTVSSTIPPNGAAGVNVNNTINAMFSEAMQSSTINTNTFTVSDGSGNIGGTVSYSGTTATFTPSSNMSDSTTYTARITTVVRDLAGNAMASPYTWSFTTTAGGVDITPPTVSSTIPANGAAEVDVSSAIAAAFSEEMDASTITTDTFIVNNGSTDINGTVSYNDTTATFTPSANLDFNTIYTATITIGAMDLAGNPIASAYTWSFTTESATITPTPIPTPAPTPTSNLYLSKETAYLDGDTIVAIVVDADRNTSLISEDILTTALKVIGSNSVVGAGLFLDLNEDGINSGTFLATIKTGTTITGGVSSSMKGNSGTIKTVQGGTATVIYTDTTPYASSLTKTLTLSSFDATLSFNADTYSVGSYTEITLADAERNTNHTEAESLLNDVSIETSFVNSTKVRIVETGADTGTFMGSIQVATSGGTLEFERIQASAGDTLKATYTDEINTTGFSITVTDTASVIAATTPTPTAIPSVTPTPGVCNAELITVFPRKLKLKKKESDDVLVTLTGEGDCPVEGETVKAKITKGKRFITVSPASAITNDDGQAAFTIMALKKGNAKVEFKSGKLKTELKVKVVK
jgi:hypothetical protein